MKNTNVNFFSNILNELLNQSLELIHWSGQFKLIHWNKKI